MCEENPQLKPYSAGAKYHHEALNGTGYPEGLKGKQIPLEGQIIRVADEFDAIVSKRQYKTHIGVSSVLKILVNETIPKSVALKELKNNTQEGKLNAHAVRALIKIVTYDTKYEIDCKYEYIYFLKEQIKRLESINTYNEKLSKAILSSSKNSLGEKISELLENGETLENFQTVLSDYRKALVERKQLIDTLFNEIKEIKKIKV